MAIHSMQHNSIVVWCWHGATRQPRGSDRWLGGSAARRRGEAATWWQGSVVCSRVVRWRDSAARLHSVLGSYWRTLMGGNGAGALEAMGDNTASIAASHTRRPHLVRGARACPQA
jgi:hypothetical protein